MTVKIIVLKAYHGDSIIIESVQEDSICRILIDGGPPECFEKKQGAKVLKGPLYQKLEELHQADEFFDITILTHTDKDHIGGLLKACKHDKYRSLLSRDFWFNSGRIIGDYLGEEVNTESLIFTSLPDEYLTSISEGIELDDIIADNCLTPRSIKLASKNGFSFKHGTIYILSPSHQQLVRFLREWKKKEPNLFTSGDDTDYQYTFEELLERDQFIEDQSISNASSIAVLIQLQDKKILLLGDALPSVVCQSLRTYFNITENNRLEVDVCKLSHHGSKANTSPELLSLLNCKKFIISSNGLRYGLPNKVTLARINSFFPNSEIFFNYEGVKKNMLSEEEVALYPQIKVISEEIYL